ncbi:MAG: SCO family protein [Dehalococcoidia bacterium]|nr:SCO family protein [Dehalococcoidia bacterium]MDW8119171.1 SCO family protein [Chloroflexota bacterium]
MRSRIFVLVGTAIVVLGAIGTALALQVRASPPYTFYGATFTPPHLAPDLALTDTEGNPFHLANFRNKVVLVFFGYTHCPDVCPATLVAVRQVLERLGGDAQRVQFVFVSVDPERDTPERLRTYVKGFDPRYIGLTGTPEQVALVANAYGVRYYKEDIGSAGGYTVAHTAFVFVIDPAGRLRLAFPPFFGMQGDEIRYVVQDIRHLLKGG